MVEKYLNLLKISLYMYIHVGLFPILLVALWILLLVSEGRKWGKKIKFIHKHWNMYENKVHLIYV
jgi:hypothetical protein